MKINTLSNKIEYLDTYGITYGAAQGSCLGPLLFIIFCNDIHLLPHIGTLILFADDTTLINSSKHKVYLEYSMWHDLKLLDNWFKANQLSLNLSKTVLMNFRQNGNNVNLDLDDIPIATTTNVLGVYLDNQLNWKLHTTILFNKIQSNKYLLSISKNLLNEQSLRSIYFAHIYSHLNYSLVTWGSMISNSDKEKLYKVQKSCIRILGCKKKRKNINYIFMDLQILPFPEMIKLELCKYGYKIFKKLLPAPLIKLAYDRGGQKTHCYNTRNKHLPNVQSHKSPQFNNSFMCQGLKEYGKLSQWAKDMSSLNGFVKQ